MTKRPKPIVLTVLDGWGYRAETKGNAIALARKPTYDELLKKFPNTLIHTSGPYVGLPEGQMGNSEVGHLNIGAGRIVHMDITRIDLLIQSRKFCEVPLFLQAMDRARKRQLHLIGLLSDGGVHSQINHLFALLEMAKQQKVENVFIHCFMDGRDTPPHSGRDFVQRLQQKIRELGVGQIATACFQLGGTLGGWAIMRPLDRYGFLPVPILFAIGIPIVACLGLPGLSVTAVLILYTAAFEGRPEIGMAASSSSSEYVATAYSAA